MTSDEREFHVQSPSGALLTRFWPGGHKAAFSPLTHYLLAAKSPNGLVLVRSEGGNYWEMPGGPIARDANVNETVAAKFAEDTGLMPRGITVLGYFRIILADCIEYGALAVCACDSLQAYVLSSDQTEARTWDFNGQLEGLDPISATLATVACSSRAWTATRP